MLKRIPYLAIILVTGLSLGWMATAPAQPPPGKKADKKGDDIARFEDRLQRLRWQFTQPERRTLLTWSGSYANTEQIWRAGQPYIADRTLAGAEVLVHASDHLERLKDPPGPPPPPAEAVSRQLADVYFRTREAGYFLQEIHDSSASPLVSLARQYYQRAVESYDPFGFSRGRRIWQDGRGAGEGSGKPGAGGHSGAPATPMKEAAV